MAFKYTTCEKESFCSLHGEKQEEIAALCRKPHVRRLAIFGSAAQSMLPGFCEQVAKLIAGKTEED